MTTSDMVGTMSGGHETVEASAVAPWKVLVFSPARGGTLVPLHRYYYWFRTRSVTLCTGLPGRSGGSGRKGADLYGRPIYAADLASHLTGGPIHCGP
jgi:hypothetical protein